MDLYNSSFLRWNYFNATTLHCNGRNLDIVLFGHIFILTSIHFKRLFIYPKQFTVKLSNLRLGDLLDGLARPLTLAYFSNV